MNGCLYSQIVGQVVLLQGVGFEAVRYCVKVVVSYSADEAFGLQEKDTSVNDAASGMLPANLISLHVSQHRVNTAQIHLILKFQHQCLSL